MHWSRLAPKVDTVTAAHKWWAKAKKMGHSGGCACQGCRQMRIVFRAHLGELKGKRGEAVRKAFMKGDL